MHSLQFFAGEGVYRVEGIVIFCGKDLCVNIAGGDTPHVGASAIASPRSSLRKDGERSASASVLCVMGHKEDLLARTAAMRLSSEFNANVNVTVGLHIDEATETDVNILLGNFDELLDMIAGRLQKRRQ
jgi:hypothetical protein